MQKRKQRMPYLLHKVKKNDANFANQVIQTLKKVLALTPSPDSIPHLISIVNPDYLNRCQALKEKFTKTNQGEKFNYDSFDRNSTQEFSKLNSQTAILYLKTALQISQLRAKSLETCLVNLLEVIHSYQSISLRKTTQKFNRSCLAIEYDNIFQYDQYLSKIASYNRDMVKAEKEKAAASIINTNHKTNNQLELAKEEISRMKTQVQKLTKMVDSLKGDLQKVKKQSKKEKELCSCSQLKIQYERSEETCIRQLIKLRQLQKNVSQLQNTNFRLKQIIGQYRKIKTIQKQEQVIFLNEDLLKDA